MVSILLPTLLTLLPGPSPAPRVPQEDIPTLSVELPIPGASEVWQPMCGGEGTLAELERAALVHRATLARPTVIGSGSSQPAGFDIVFVAGSSVPAEALPALASCATYLEGTFSDPIQVTIQVSFQSLDPSNLGYTASARVTVPYTSGRAKVVADMDGNDTIQSWLPPAPGFAVSYPWFLPGVTFPAVPAHVTAPVLSFINERELVFHTANWKAVGGTTSVVDAKITINSTLPFDYDPTNGVPSTHYSFRDVVIHEVGHALGFSSAGDSKPIDDSKMLDMFRFVRTDGFFDANPDTVAEFQTYARNVVKGLPNDDHISDLISVEYRMADGDPKQMSHFRKESPRIGLMDTSQAKGVTNHPNYYMPADLTMLDAIGYDR